MVDKSTEPSQFDWPRGVVIAVGVTAFIGVFRPFGIHIETALDVLAVLGFAPLNFAAILLAHRIPAQPVGMLMRTGAIILANMIYGFSIGGGASWSIAFSVAFVAALVVGAVALWNRERALHREVIELRHAAKKTRDDMITLHGDGAREILRLRIGDLFFISAKGNYAEVCYWREGAAKTTLLRASLKALALQAGDDTLKPSHRSFLVNLRAAQRIVADGGRMTIEFPGGVTAPVSRRYHHAIRTAALDAAPTVPR